MDYTTDFTEIKAILKELVKSQAETNLKFQETDAKFKETDAKFKETDAKFKETDAKFQEMTERFKETDVKFKETDLQIKRAFALFEGQWGKLIESLVEGDLIGLLQQRGVEVHHTMQRVKGNRNGQNFEFDIIAHNGKEIVIVEVKTTLRVKQVQHFIEKLRYARQWLNEYQDYKVYGAIAFLRAEEGSDVYAENEQLFVIKATGKSATIINKENFTPKFF